MRYANQHCKMVRDGKDYIIEGNCIMTKKPVTVRVAIADVAAYYAGTYIQDAFPYLSADDREFLMTGLSREAWEQTFGSENVHSQAGEDA